MHRLFALTLEGGGGSINRSMAKRSKKHDESEEKLGFEEALERLEAVVERLGQGDLQLETSLEAFEDGVRLSRQCAEQLDSVEKRVEVLTRDGAGWKASFLAPEEEEEA